MEKTWETVVFYVFCCIFAEEVIKEREKWKDNGFTR